MKLVIMSFIILALNPCSFANDAQASSEFEVRVRYNIMAGSDEIKRNQQFAKAEAWRQAVEACDEHGLETEEVTPVEALSYPIADTYHMVSGTFLCK